MRDQAEGKPLLERTSGVAIDGPGAGPEASMLAETGPAKSHEVRVLQALRRIIRAVDIHSRKLAAQHTITAPQLVCLLTVRDTEPTTASGIAREVHLSPSTVVGILDRLEAKDLIRRERDRKDRRLVQVSLTEPGKVLIESAPSPLQETLAAAMLALPETEQAAIVDALERVVEMMEVRELDAAAILETGPIDSPPGS